MYFFFQRYMTAIKEDALKQAMQFFRLLIAFSPLAALPVISGCQFNNTKPSAIDFSFDTNLVVNSKAFQGDVYSSPIPVGTILDLLMQEDFSALDELYEEFAQAYARNPRNDQAYVWSYRPFGTPFKEVTKKIKLWKETGSRHARLAAIVNQPFSMPEEFEAVRKKTTIEHDESSEIRYRSDHPEYRNLAAQRINDLIDFIALYPKAIPAYCSILSQAEYAFTMDHTEYQKDLIKIALQGIENNPYSYSVMNCAMSSIQLTLPKKEALPLQIRIANRSKPLWKHYPKVESIYWTAYIHAFGIQDTESLLKKRGEDGSDKAKAFLGSFGYNGTTEEVINKARSTIEIDPFNAKVRAIYASRLMDRVHDLMQKGNRKAAIELLSTVDHVDMSYVVTLDDIARVYVQAEEFLMATRTIETFLQFNGDSESALYQLKTLYTMMDRKEQALAACFRLKVLDSEYMCEEEQDAI